VRVDGDLGWLVAQAQQRRERGGARGLAEHEHLQDPRAAGRLDGLVGKGRDGEQVAGAGVVQLGDQLLHGVQRVDGGVGPPGQQHPVEGDRVLGQVGAVGREHLALLEAARGQAAGHQPGAADQLAVGDGAAAGTVDQRRLGRRDAASANTNPGSETSGMVASE
jgi:hypothetical protein